MRPRRLIINAFGPYCERQEVDFAAFEEERFFLIHGPTGAGKTTLLDALSFALYGDSSGGHRRPSQLRSDHAPPDRRTEVTLRFSLGEREYEITRSPEWLREKRRGGGLAREEAQATLFRVKADGDTEPLVTGAQKVTRKIVELLGFESDQFRQVVCLPQNQFSRFLLAGSKEREALLETLFRTERYRRLQERLDLEARSLEAEAREKSLRIQGVLAAVGVETPEAVDRLLAETLEKRAALETQQSKLRAALDDARIKLAEARRIAALFAELEAAEHELKKLESVAFEMKGRERELADGRRAIPLVEKEIGLASRREFRRAAEREEMARAAALKTARAACAQALGALKREQDRTEERARLELQWRRLLEQQESVVAWEEALKQSEATARRLAVIKEGLVKAEKEREAARVAALAPQTEIPRVEAQAGQAELLAPMLKQVEEELRARERLAALKRERAPIETKAGQLRVRLGEIKKEGEKARIALRRIEMAWMEGQALVLAARLADGHPCPVCGATEHPRKATASSGHGESAVALERAREKMDALEKAWLAARTECEAEEKRLAIVDAQIRTLEEAHASDETDKSGEAPHVRRTRLLTALEGARAASLRLPLLKAQAESTDERRQRAEQLVARTREEMASAERLAAESRTIVDKLRGQLGNETITARAWEAKIASLQKEIALRDKSLESARKLWEERACHEAAAVQALASATEGARRAGDELDQLEAAFRESVIAAGFADTEAFACARRSPEAIAGLEAECAEFRRAMAAAESRAARARESVHGLGVPATAEKETLVAGLERESAEWGAERGACDARVASLERARAECAGLGQEMARCEASYRTLGRLGEVAKGDNPVRMTFQRFVLAAFLEEVLELASVRLLSLSRGRFTLRRALKSVDARLSGGLDLEVDDAYTGVARPVGTLSGGEGFLASLALALGLSDVVQAHAGGIHLEALFVDEGFGTLDPESLDLALRTLMDLQRGGRLVGIISHVPELRGLIRARIEVRPERGGSRLTVRT